MPKTSPGERLRKSICSQYEVEGVAAEAMVDAICRTADELAALEDAVAKHGALIDGARGQLVANPALSAIGRHRALLAKLLAQAFPGEVESVSEKATRAARARWGPASKVAK